MSGNANSPPGPAHGPLTAAAEALAFAFGFVARNFGAILRRIAIPGLLGCIVLHVWLWGYCSQLIEYLGFPSEGMAGRVMGIAAAGLLVMLLLHAVVISRLAELMTDRQAAQPAFLGIRSDAWRLYVSNLRLLLALGLYGAAAVGVSSLMHRLNVAPGVDLGFSIAAWLLLFWLAARGWFFLAPVSLQVSEEGVLVMSWRRSRGHLLVIAIVMLAMLLLTLLLLGGGEYLLRFAGVLSPVPATLSMINAVGLYQRNLWPVVILVSLVYLCAASLLTAARLKLHQDLAATPPV